MTPIIWTSLAVFLCLVLAVAASCLLDHHHHRRRLTRRPLGSMESSAAFAGLEDRMDQVDLALMARALDDSKPDPSGNGQAQVQLQPDPSGPSAQQLLLEGLAIMDRLEIDLQPPQQQVRSQTLVALRAWHQRAKRQVRAADRPGIPETT